MRAPRCTSFTTAQRPVRRLGVQWINGSIWKGGVMRRKFNRKNEEGRTLVEFAIVGTVFLTVMFGVIEFGRLYWTHNALRGAARRGVRYAAIRRNDTAGQQAVKNMVVYGNPNGGTTPLVPGLKTSNIGIEYVNYDGVQLSSRATVKITNYQFQFAVP